MFRNPRNPLPRSGLCAVVALFVASMFFGPDARSAHAHGDVEVGDFALVIGFAVEPAYGGEPNGLDLRVTRMAAASPATAGSEESEAVGHEEGTEEHEHAPGEADDHAAGQPVEGLESTLQAELIFGASKKTLAIEPKWNEPGAYTAAVIPTEAGDYTWRIFGTIEGTPVDVSLTSSPDTFASVVTKADVAFPEPEVSGAELSQRLTDLDTRVTEMAAADQSMMPVRGLGGIALVLALIALAVAVVALRRTPA